MREAREPMSSWDHKLMVRLIRHRYAGADRNADARDRRRYGEDITDHIVAIAYSIWRKHPDYWASAIAKYAVSAYWREHTAFYRGSAPESSANNWQDILANLKATDRERLRIPKWLPKQQRFILNQLLLGYGQREIADQLGITRQHVGLLKRQAIAAIRDDNPHPGIGKPVPKLPRDIGPFCEPTPKQFQEYQPPEPIPWEMLYDRARHYLGAEAIYR